MFYYFAHHLHVQISCDELMERLSRVSFIYVMLRYALFIAISENARGYSIYQRVKKKEEKHK